MRTTSPLRKNVWRLANIIVSEHFKTAEVKFKISVTYDLEAVSRQSYYGSSNCLGEICALWLFVFLDHMQKLNEKQIDPQPLHSYWILIKGMNQLCDSSLNLLV